MAPDTSPRPRPRPGEGFDLPEFLSGLELPTVFERAWAWLISMSDLPVWPGAIGACALALLFGFWVARRLRRRRERPCRWKTDARQRGGTLTRWRCRTCGAEAYSQDGKPPKECKKALRVVPL